MADPKQMLTGGSGQMSQVPEELYNTTMAAPVMTPLSSAGPTGPMAALSNMQFPSAAPNYMSPGPVYPTQAPPVNTNAGLSGVSGNYAPSTISAPGGAGYSNPGNHNQVVQQSIDAFSDQGGAYLANAARRGLEAANSRGVMNSSLGAGLASRSAMEAMQPYVSQAVDLNKTREGFAFQSGENSLDRSLTAAVENGRLSQSMAELLATHQFQGNQAGFDRTLQSALQTGRINAEEASQLRTIGFQSMQNSLDRTQQQSLANQNFAYQGEQNYLDRENRAKLQSDGAFQQDWLSSRSFSRDFQSQLSMIPLGAAADLTSYLSKYAIENPEIYTPEVISGMSNFLSQNMSSVLNQYFPNQQTSVSYSQTGPVTGGNNPPQQAGNNLTFTPPPVQAM